MRSGLKYLGVLVLGLVCFTARADVFSHPVAGNQDSIANLERLAGKFAAQTNLKGEFVQEKFLSVLTKPLRSHGFFSVSAGAFDWRITHPFSVSYHYANGELYKQTEDSRELVEPADDPMLYGFFVFFSSIFDMSQAELQKMFELYFTRTDDDGWVLGLLPKNDLLKRSMQSIVVEGHEVSAADQGVPTADDAMTVIISKVSIHEPSGDYSQLLFSY